MILENEKCGLNILNAYLYTEQKREGNTADDNYDAQYG